MNNLETVQGQKTALNVETILVAVDLSPHSERTVAYAVSIARQFGASLKVIHVFEPQPNAEFGRQEMNRLLEQDREDTKWRLASLVDRARANYPKCETFLRTGDLAEQVAIVASLVRADLIVVGRHHQTFLGRFFKLDRAPEIVHRATCPVLVWEDNEN